MIIVQVAKSLVAMLLAPIRVRRHRPRPPEGPEHYAIATLARSPQAATTKATDIPTAHTPPGRWKDWPPMVLAGCDDPLVDGAPDLRGVWQV
jgi:hypothetical protein